MCDPLSTYIGRKTTTLWTFQDRIQSAPEAGIRLYNTGQLAPVSLEACLPP